MPRANLQGYSNALAGERVSYVSSAEFEQAFEDQEQQAGLEIAALAQEDIAEDEEAGSSAGTSSLTSGSKQDKSGTSTGTDPQSPAPTTDSPSFKGRPQNQESSTAPSTGGSTQGTGSARPSQQASSAASRPGAQATQGRGTKGSGTR